QNFALNYMQSFVNGTLPANCTTYQGAVSNLGYGTISGLTEQGLPPGNYDPGNPGVWTGYSANGNNPVNPSNPGQTSAQNPTKIVLGTGGGAVYGFTDMIPFVSYPQTVGGITFNSDADMVEASRGNLESTSLANLAIPDGTKGGTNGPSKAGVTIGPGSGTYLAYWDLVRQNAHPMSDALVAAGDFFTTLNTISNAHFSLVAYSDQIGTSTNSTEIPNGPSGSPWAYSPAYNIDPVYYLQGGTSTIFNSPSGWTPALGWGMPYFALQSTDSPANSNYPSVLLPLTGTTSTTSSNQFPVTPVTVGPVGSTNMKAALTEGYTELQPGGGVRQHAQKTVIVLFTDGIPDYPSGAGGPDYGAFGVASQCSTAGIPIYTIGFSQNPAVMGTVGTSGQWTELDVLGDNQNGSGPGISYLAGHGGAYFPVTNKTQLEQAFNQIASALVTLQYQSSN
ncbi:MAG TPA: vWA domain-containing protein, partial [Chroococcales cyanobacterium]